MKAAKAREREDRIRQHASRVRSPEFAAVTLVKERPGFPIANDLKQ